MARVPSSITTIMEKLKFVEVMVVILYIMVYCHGLVFSSKLADERVATGKRDTN